MVLRDSSQDLEARRKLLLWRASHRGIREVDLALGGFVRDNIDSMQPSELDELEALITLPDPQLLAWIMGSEPVDENYRNGTTERLLAYRLRSI
ncbi:MAG TPA: succinate dehydrogenase assembly factor 2 [Aestuariivirgaceae bacterium]|jgi:antitoxin CptB